MQWYDRKKLTEHTERLSQSPRSLWEQELNRYPSTVNHVYVSAWITASN